MPLQVDPSRGAGQHQLVSTRATFAYELPPFVHHLARGGECGCSPGCRLLRVTFHRERTPLPDGRTEHEACLQRDELLKALGEPRDGGGRGSGRGRGRGGGKGGNGKGGKGGEKGKGGKGGGKGKGGRGGTD